MEVQDLINKVDTAALVARPLSDWRPILAKEVNVFVFGENYLAKRFDQINFKFCSKDEAKEILIDNIYALLRYKYFPKASEEIDERIAKIVSSFTANLKTTLLKVSFDKNSNSNVVKMLPEYCVAFRNGVYNFRDNKWFFKYDIIKLDKLYNTIYMYDTQYIIQWYFDYDFESLDIDILSTPLDQFIEIMKTITTTSKNYCFELMYNICHTINHQYSFERFEHLCEILGYTLLQPFSQYFVLLIGSGQNGKNSLFDGCFTGKILPRPAANDLDSIENDRFITGALENKYHNLFLETSAKTYTESKMIKALTGSIYQTIENKGENKYSGIINCKYVFAGNDQDKIKFSDNTVGFRRRINAYEIYYKWDSKKKFMKDGDYYDTTFGSNLSELKDDITNTTAYIYFAMYGILHATNNFKEDFKFSHNEWSNKYAEIDDDLKDIIDNLTFKDLIKYLSTSYGYEAGKTLMFDENQIMLKNSPTIKDLGYETYEDLIDMLRDNEQATAYFAEHDIYIAFKILQSMCNNFSTSNNFTSAIKKIYSIKDTPRLYANKPFVKISFVGNKLILKN